MKLLKVLSVDEAIDQLTHHFVKHFHHVCERIPLEQAKGRTLSKALFSLEDVPNFRRSTVDGYAVVAHTTHGASDSMPSVLTLVSSIEMGQSTSLVLQAGEAAYVPTGGMVPENADAVVMVEYCECFSHSDLLVYTAVAAHENIVEQGDDVQEGHLLFDVGQYLGTLQLAQLASVGIHELDVYRKLKALVVSTGDELQPIEAHLEKGQVHDINQVLIKSSLETLGVEVVETVLLRDDYDELFTYLSAKLNQVDIILLSGGSSQGDKDYSAQLIENLGQPGLWMHGLNIKPGKPTILGSVGSTLYLGLPGHPVSAFTVFNRLFKTAYQKVFNHPILPTISAQLDTNVSGSAGKETIIYVQLTQENNAYHAHIMYSKSGLIHTLHQAHGYIIIPAHLEGLAKGARVDVILL